MPYKDPEKQKAALHKHYADNKAKWQERQKHRRLIRKNWFDSLKATLQCKRCGETFAQCLEFHHPNEDKDTDFYSIFEMVTGLRPLARIIAEIEKCVVLCTNCHRKVHYGGASPDFLDSELVLLEARFRINNEREWHAQQDSNLQPSA